MLNILHLYLFSRMTSLWPVCLCWATPWQRLQKQTASIKNMCLNCSSKIMSISSVLRASILLKGEWSELFYIYIKTLAMIINWTCAELLYIRPSGTSFSSVWIKIQDFSLLLLWTTICFETFMDKRHVDTDSFVNSSYRIHTNYICLTHWPLGDLNEISDRSFSS